MTNEEFNEVVEEIDNDIPFYDDYDAHCCSAEADENGVCQFCGAIIYGSWAYREIYGANKMWWFIIGVIVGANFGIAIHCLFLINKKEEKND